MFSQVSKSSPYNPPFLSSKLNSVKSIHDFHTFKHLDTWLDDLPMVMQNLTHEVCYFCGLMTVQN